MKTLIYAATFLLIASTSFGQNITFNIEKGQVFDKDGTPLRSEDNTVDIRENFTVWAGFALGNVLTDFTSGVEAFKSDLLVSNLNETLSSVSWEAVPIATGFLANANDFGLNAKEGAPGSTPLLLITSSTSFDNLTTDDQIGLVGSTTTVEDIGTQLVNFTGFNSWDTEYLGTLGSLTLQAVPEPSSFAAVAGVMTLGLVMMRRRA
jgi:hypothetical protein